MCAAVVLCADVVQIGAVGQGILRDKIDIAAIKVNVHRWLAIGGDKTVAEDHVSGAEPSRISAAEKDGVFGHFRVERLAVSAVEWGRKHVVPEPITEPMVALLIIRPVGHNGIERH